MYFPSTAITCSNIALWLSELPVAFDNKYSQLTIDGRVFEITSGKGSQYHSNLSPNILQLEKTKCSKELLHSVESNSKF